MKRAIIAVLVAILAACASADRRAYTDFRFSGESFEMRALAASDYPEGDTRAEAIRIDWLERYLSLNGLCPNGYTITNRTAVRIGSFIGDSHDIFYEGRCR